MNTNYSRRFIAESREGTLKLNILEAADADEGDYTCEAVNNIGFIYCTGHLKIGSEYMTIVRVKP